MFLGSFTVEKLVAETMEAYELCFQLDRAGWGQPRAQGHSAWVLQPLGSPGAAALGRVVGRRELHPPGTSGQGESSWRCILRSVSQEMRTR